MSVSLIIPCYNIDKYINDLCKILSSHSLEEFEFIFVDDCSSDNTFEIVNSYALIDTRFKLFKNSENLGISETREVGVKIATKEFICFLDGDDLIDLDVLLLQIDQLKENEGEALISGWMNMMMPENILITKDMKKVNLNANYKKLHLTFLLKIIWSMIFQPNFSK